MTGFYCSCKKKGNPRKRDECLENLLYTLSFVCGMKTYGVLVFKWNDMEIPYKKVLARFSEKPLIMNITTGPKTLQTKGSRSYWFTFMKIPKEQVVLNG